MGKLETPRAILEEAQAIVKGHFVLKSGNHSSHYINKDAVYTDPHTVSNLGMDMGQPFTDFIRKERGLPNIDVVIGPAIGGVVLAHCVGKHIAYDRKGTLRTIFADKDGDGFVIKRGYDKFVTDKHVLVVEDILTTGSSVKATVEAIRRVGGIVEGVAAICNRGNVTAEQLTVPQLVSLLVLEMHSWMPENCALCVQGVPINTDLGHGAAYVAKHGQPAG